MFKLIKMGYLLTIIFAYSCGGSNSSHLNYVTAKTDTDALYRVLGNVMMRSECRVEGFVTLRTCDLNEASVDFFAFRQQLASDLDQHYTSELELLDIDMAAAMRSMVRYIGVPMEKELNYDSLLKATQEQEVQQQNYEEDYRNNEQQIASLLSSNKPEAKELIADLTDTNIMISGKIRSLEKLNTALNIHWDTIENLKVRSQVLREVKNTLPTNFETLTQKLENSNIGFVLADFEQEIFAIDNFDHIFELSFQKAKADKSHAGVVMGNNYTCFFAHGEAKCRAGNYSYEKTIVTPIFDSAEALRDDLKSSSSEANPKSFSALFIDDIPLECNLAIIEVGSDFVLPDKCDQYFFSTDEVFMGYPGERNESESTPATILGYDTTYEITERSIASAVEQDNKNSNNLFLFGGPSFLCKWDRKGAKCFGVESSSLEPKYFDIPEANLDQIATGYKHTCYIKEENVICLGAEPKKGTREIDSIEISDLRDIETGEKTTKIVKKEKNYLEQFYYIEEFPYLIGRDNIFTSLAPGATKPIIASAADYLCVVDGQGLRCHGCFNKDFDIRDHLDEYQLGKTIFVCPKALKIENYFPKDLPTPTLIATAPNHLCLKNALGVQCFGDNSFGQTTVPANVHNPSVISLGNNHSCAIENGEITCWGDGSKGQRDVPPNLVRPRALTTFDDYTCAFHDDGVSCWGQRTWTIFQMPSSEIPMAWFKVFP